LEKAQELRQLSGIELDLLRSLKARSLGLATLIKSRAKQHSRLRWIRQGDANTNFFICMRIYGGKNTSSESCNL